MGNIGIGDAPIGYYYIECEYDDSGELIHTTEIYMKDLNIQIFTNANNPDSPSPSDEKLLEIVERGLEKALSGEIKNNRFGWAQAMFLESIRLRMKILIKLYCT